MHIYIGGDHAGFTLKEKLKHWLEKQGHTIRDIGPLTYDKKDDYPDYTFPIAEAVARSRNAFGIIIAGSGIGETIAANKVKGIRAVLYHGKNPNILTTSKIHDNANILCMGSRFLSEREAKASINVWLKTSFRKGKRHVRRLGKITAYERKR